MTRKPRRHALSVPVRSGSEVGFPQSLGEVHDMLYSTVAPFSPMVKPATVAACCYKNRIAFFASLRRSAAGV